MLRTVVVLLLIYRWMGRRAEEGERNIRSSGCITTTVNKIQTTPLKHFSGILQKKRHADAKEPGRLLHIILAALENINIIIKLQYNMGATLYDRPDSSRP